mmetsp:Transcript_22015/g.63128  ORF Transcript_22015/g.63128 Transcript_22015/m.63128 type:complete len:200 (+) Transcript_22015:762-1361(+)
MQSLQLGSPICAALTSRQEIKGQGLVAMDVDKSIHFGLIHLAKNMVDLRRSFKSWCFVIIIRSFLSRRGPLSVEIGAASIGPKMTSGCPIGVHRRNNVKGVHLENLGDHSIDRAGSIQTQQSSEETLGIKLGHILARMLAMNDPASPISTSQCHTLDLPTVQGLAKRFHFASWRRLTARNEFQMTLVTVGWEIGKVDTA